MLPVKVMISVVFPFVFFLFCTLWHVVLKFEGRVMNFECVGYRDKLCMIIDIIDDDDYERQRKARKKSFSFKEVHDEVTYLIASK